MEQTNVDAAISRLRTIATEVGALRQELDELGLAVSDRQYVSRCFDLLGMELTALQEFLEANVSHSR
jgi:hypothetical protein